MKEFLVTWQIEVLADNETAAAQFAKSVQMDPETEAMYFVVTDSEGTSTQIQLVTPPDEGDMH